MYASVITVDRRLTLQYCDLQVCVSLKKYLKISGGRDNYLNTTITNKNTRAQWHNFFTVI